MSNRNVIQLKIDIDSDQVVSHEQGIAAIKEHKEVKKLNLKYLSSVNDLVESLDVTRATFERNILENANIDTGVRHLYVTGINFPRTRIYIDAIDLVEYLVTFCELTYWKKVKIGNDQYELKALKNNSISKEDVEYLAITLIEGRLKSSKQIEGEFNRTRRIVSRLNNILETITFSFPDSQRQLRRFVFSPSDDSLQMENYFANYKRYENKVTKVSKDY